MHKIIFSSILSLLVALGSLNIASAQKVKVEYSRPVVQSGISQVPWVVRADTIFLYRGEEAVSLKPGFYTSGYSNVSSTGSYFKAYIGTVAYATLSKELGDYYYPTVAGTIYFRYDEKYLDNGNLNYTIYDYQRNKIATNKDLKIGYVGANFFSIDLSSVPTFVSRDFNLEKNKYYTLEVYDKKGDLYKLRFKYIQ